MGLGYVPTGTLRQERQGNDVPRRERRGARADLGSLTSRRIGSIGEAVAADFLRRRGASIVARNVRVGRGEIDLLAIIARERAAIEVKTVLASASSDPIFNFDVTKRNRVKELAGRLGIWRVDYVGLELSPEIVLVHWLPRV